MCHPPLRSEHHHGIVSFFDGHEIVWSTADFQRGFLAAARCVDDADLDSGVLYFFWACLIGGAAQEKEGIEAVDKSSHGRACIVFEDFA